MTSPARVHSFKGTGGVASASPFCLKLLTWLRMAEVPHEVNVLARPPSSSTGKVPYLERADGELIEDSERIIDLLVREHQVTLDSARSEHDHAQGLLLRQLVESHLYFAVLWARWHDDAGWAVTRSVYFSEVPAMIRPLLSRSIRIRVVRDLWGQGTGREHASYIHAEAAEALSVLATALGDRDWFLGTPGRVDAAVHGLLANIHHWPHDEPIQRSLRAHPTLMDFVERVDTAWWSDLADGGS